MLNDIPLPNQSGDSVTHLNNWFAGDANSATDYYNVITRVDHNISDQMRIFGRWDRNFRDGGKKNAYSWETNARQYTHSGRNNDGGVVDVVDTLSPSTILSARLGFNRYVYSSVYNYQDLSYLGIPVTSQLQTPGKYPVMSFTNYISTSVEDNDYSPSENICRASIPAEGGGLSLHEVRRRVPCNPLRRCGRAELRGELQPSRAAGPVPTRRLPTAPPATPSRPSCSAT